MQLTLDPIEMASPDWIVQLTTRHSMSRGEYRAFVAAHPGLRIERTAKGEVIVMPPAHARSGYECGEVILQLANWAIADGRGITFDSSAGFDLPNGANRSPDAAWVLQSRLQALSAEELSEYPPLCPDFVIEVRSKSDRLAAVQEKMTEYLENGAQLGFLIDPIEKRLYVYRPGHPAETLEEPASVTGGPELPGFALDLGPIWNPPVWSSRRS